MTDSEKKELVIVSSQISKLIMGKFYGTLEVKFEGGTVKFMRKSEVIVLNGKEAN